MGSEEIFRHLQYHNHSNITILCEYPNHSNITILCEYLPYVVPGAHQCAPGSTKPC